MTREEADVCCFHFLFLFTFQVSNLTSNPGDFCLNTTQAKTNNIKNVRPLVLWNEACSLRDVSPAFLEILLLNLKILPVVPEESQFLFVSEMIEIVQFDEEEFRVIILRRCILCKRLNRVKSKVYHVKGNVFQRGIKHARLYVNCMPGFLRRCISGRHS